MIRIATEFSGSSLRPIATLFTRHTGIACEFVSVGKNPDTWMDAAEEQNCDLFVTSVSDDLERASRQGKLLCLSNFVDALSDVPDRFKARDGYWTGYAYRVRAFFHHVHELLIPDSYLELAGPAWKNMIASRKMDHKYNHALVAYMLERHGAADTERWLRCLVAHDAFFQGELGDKNQAKLVMQGRAAIAICNSYYLSELLHDHATRGDAAQLRIHYPQQDDTGAFALVNGVGILAQSAQKHSALRFVQYLLSDEIQLLIGSLVTQYPVVQTVNNADCIGGILKTYGAIEDAEYSPPKIDPIDVFTTTSRTPEARLLISKVFG